MGGDSAPRPRPVTRNRPRVSLAELPTPVQRLDALGDHLGLPNLYVKRDDRTGTLYGGNKVRKLEFLLGEALDRGCDRVWTVGGIGSNHVLATSLYARRQGLKPEVLHFPQPVTQHVQDNLRALSTTRPDLRLVAGEKRLLGSILLRRLRCGLGLDPGLYCIAMGGSSPTGALGYVEAAFELRQQIRAGTLPEPDVIFVAAGTCGTMAGLTLGCHVAGLDCEVVGVRVTRPLYANHLRCWWLIRRTAARLKETGETGFFRPSPADFQLLHRYFGDDYGRPTESGRRATELARAHTDLTLEPTYTAKTLAALVGERDRWNLADRNVLYWHTLSGADLSDRIARSDPERDLPEAYRRFLPELTAE